jgi:hypothetical protein
VKHQNDQPSNYSADSTDQYSDEIAGDIIRLKQVRQKEEGHPDYSVDDKSPHGSRPRYQKQNYQYNQDDEDDRLHKAIISP